MSLFGAITTSGSGLYVYRKWLDSVSDNIANVNTVRPTNEAPFRPWYIQDQAVSNGSDSGAVVTGAVRGGDPNGRMVYEPSNPLADKQGYVRYPDIDLSDQMTMLIMAQRAYQANLAVVQSAKEAYSQALTIGR